MTASAESINVLDYDRFEFSNEIYETQLNELVDYLKQYEDDHYIVLTARNDGSFDLNVILKETISNYTASHNLNINSSNFVSQFNSDTSTSIKPKFLSFNYYNWNNFEDKLNEIKNKFESESYSISQNQSYLISSSSSFSYDYDTEESTLIPKKVLYYTNVDFKFISDQFSIQIGNTVINDNDIFISYLDYKPNNEIILTKTFANDLEGTEIYIVKADFSNVYKSGYSYEYKTSRSNWVDITDYINSSAEQGYYFYNYNCYYNTDITFRVLDENNELVVENTISVNELNDYGFVISHAPAEDLQGRFINAITIDLRNCWSNEHTYQYSFDNNKFYDMNVSEDNKMFILNHGIQTFLYFRILGQNGNVIHTQSYEEIFDGIIKHIQTLEDTYIDDKANKFIIATVDFTEFSEFSDMYNLKYVLENVDGDTIILDSEDTYTYTFDKDFFETFKGVNISVYIDDFLVDSAYYLPSLGGSSFNDKYDQIVQDKIDEELENLKWDTPEDLANAIVKFIKSIVDILGAVISVVFFFYDNLNDWIRLYIVAILAVFIVCKSIKGARK